MPQSGCVCVQSRSSLPVSRGKEGVLLHETFMSSRHWKRYALSTRRRCPNRSFSHPAHKCSLNNACPTPTPTPTPSNNAGKGAVDQGSRSVQSIRNTALLHMSRRFERRWCPLSSVCRTQKRIPQSMPSFCCLLLCPSTVARKSRLGTVEPSLSTAATRVPLEGAGCMVYGVI